MSVSEKLRTLKETGFTCEHWTDLDASDIDVTDELIAVVEAAAASSAHHDYWMNAENCSLCAALAALDEALSGAEGPLALERTK